MATNGQKRYMNAFSIENTKNFMSQLLIGDVFDSFLLEEASITTYNTFTINGRIVPEYFDDFEIGGDEFSSWKDIKPMCFDLIKGKMLPVSFHFILQLKSEEIEKILRLGSCKTSVKDIKSFTLNIKYVNHEITLITATSFNTFIMDKNPDILWDQYIEKFLKSHSLY